MKFLGRNTVVVLSPHPDDAEYSISGTVLKYDSTQFIIVTVSLGGDFDLASQERKKEVDLFWKDVPNVHGGDCILVSSHIKDSHEDALIHRIERRLKGIAFDSVMIPPKDDYHFEHATIHRVGRSLARHQKISMIEYNTPSADHKWCPNVYVDITSVYPLKRQRLAAFKTQDYRKYFSDRSIDSFHTNYFCDKREIGLHECFYVDFLFA